MPLGTTLNTTFQDFIQRQPLFFVATAAETGRVNVSPKGGDSLRILDANRIVWLNLSGSGNETAVHVRETGRMTLMFASFDGAALILRVYGTARVLHPRDDGWDEAAALFPDYAGQRQIFDLAVEAVQTSCGTGVPEMTLQRSRLETELEPYHADMGPEGVTDFWRRKNTVSIDGVPTGILDEAAGAAS